MNTITDTDIHRQVTETTNASDGHYDVDGIVRTIIDHHGRVDINEIDHDDYWAIVLDHAIG